jgi:hypothetical protein
VEVVHARCAGLDMSKRDAKVCVRIAGAGRRKTVETVTTWGSMMLAVPPRYECRQSGRVRYARYQLSQRHEARMSFPTPRRQSSGHLLPEVSTILTTEFVSRACPIGHELDISVENWTSSLRT